MPVESALKRETKASVAKKIGRLKPPRAKVPMMPMIRIAVVKPPNVV